MKKGTFILGLLTIVQVNFIFCQIHPASVITGYFRGVTRSLRDIPVADQVPQLAAGREFGENDKANKRVRFNVANPNAQSVDASLQRGSQLANTNTPTSVPLTFDGNGQSDNTTVGFGGVYPPDPSMSVGPNHVVQMINLVHSVYNKSGTRLTGPLKFSTIAAGSGATDDGDPFVLYDQLADRWLLMQFSNVFSAAGSDRLIFCISKTNDPTGAYDIFSFNTPSGVGPDYPHIAIWPNAYLITTHEFNSPSGSSFLGQGFYAIDRKKMLQGPGTVNMIRFVDPSGFGYLPASLDGYKTPEATSLPMFWSWDSDETGAATDRLFMRTANLNFLTPASSTLSPVTVYNTSAFDGSSPSSRSAIEQPGTSVSLDAIADRMMSRVIYRRFDNDESIAFNYTVNVSGTTATTAATYQAAIRWGEMKRATPAAPWTINQQSTFSPDAGNGPLGYNRWMGSIGIDQKGGIAIGYTRSGGLPTPPTATSDSFPSLFYAERNACAPTSTLSSEQLFYKGSGSQTGTANRWGDYSGMAIDPSDETTFWFTHEYYAATSNTTFKTRIGSFQIAPCAASPSVHFKFGGTSINESAANTLVAGSTCLKYKDTTIIIQIDQAPTQPVNITLTANGTATAGLDYDLIYSPIVLTAANLSAAITLRIYNDGILENDEFVNIGYTMNVNGGNAVAGTYNQLHRVTIFDDEIDPASLTGISTYGSAVTVFSDNFDGIASGLGTWTERNVFLTTGATNPNHWFVGVKGGTGFLNKSMYISDNADTIHYSIITGGINPYAQVRVESPLINITGKGQAALTFTYKCNGESPSYDFGSLWYSIDGGLNWSTFGSTLLGVSTATTTTVNLPAAAENVSNLKIGFQWQSDYSVVNQPPFGIDNVSLTAKPVSSVPPVQVSVNGATAPSIRFGPNQTISYFDPGTNRIMATLINNSAFDWGCTKVEVDRSGTGAVNFNSLSPAYQLASKTFKVTPTNNNTGASYTIRLYYTEAEIAGWESATGQNRAQLNIVKVAGNNHIADVTPLNYNTYSYTNQPAPITTAYTNGYYLQSTFSATGFSGFGIGLNPSSALPVTLVSFTGRHENAIGNILKWEVERQIRIDHYELERSPDGISFNQIGNIVPKSENGSTLNYDFTDKLFQKGNNFYRLKIIDLDGQFHYSNIVLINVSLNGTSIVIYPNPVKDLLFVNYLGDATSLKLEITNHLGQKVYMANVAVQRPLLIPVSNLQSGEYLLKINGGGEKFTHKFIKL